MANPFNVLNPQNPMSSYGMGNLQTAYQALAGAKNPMQAFQRLASQSPQMQPILQALRRGSDPQQIFNALCQQRGIDPREFIRNITGNNAF